METRPEEVMGLLIKRQPTKHGQTDDSPGTSSESDRHPTIPMADQLQQLILDSLATASSIPDTRSLTVPGDSSPATSQDAQLVIQGALNSLLSKEARLDTLLRADTSL